MPQIGDYFYDDKSFAWANLLGQDRWFTWDPVFGSLTVVGAPSYFGRFRVVGRAVEIEVRFSAATSIASVAGTDYLNLPIPAVGYAGIGAMTNDTTNIAVGLCHLDVTNSRLYLPTQIASGNTFTIYCAYEI